MSIGDLLGRLRQLDYPDACLGRTPMIPIHRNTLKEIIAALESRVARIAMVDDRQLFQLAADINDSEPLMRVFASPEWDCLSEDGKLWVCALVRETLRRAGAGRPTSA